MGVFYYIHSVALIEDLPEFEYENPEQFYTNVNNAYNQVSGSSILDKFDLR